MQENYFNKELINKIIDLAKQFNVIKLIQFGSSLEHQLDCNDYDFACDGLNDKRFFRFGASLESLLNKQVDLIPMQPRTPFIEYIEENGRVIYDAKNFS